jgi:hypothetical protein
MKQGDTFEVSIKYKQLTGAQAFRWQIQELNSSGAIVKTWWSVGEPEVQQEFLVADGWKLIKYIFTVSNAATTKARFWIQGGQDYVKYTRSFQLKDFKIHKITNKIGDSSGLGNSGTLVLPQYYSFTNDTILGTRALYSRGDDNGSAYIDPSVMTYLIQAVAGVVVAVGAVVGIYWRKARKKVSEKLGVDENANKEVESDDIFVNVDSEK